MPLATDRDPSGVKQKNLSLTTGPQIGNLFLARSLILVEGLVAGPEAVVLLDEAEVARIADRSELRSVGVGDQAAVKQVDEPADPALLELFQRVPKAGHTHLVVERTPAALGRQQRLSRPGGDGDVAVECRFEVAFRASGSFWMK